MEENKTGYYHGVPYSKNDYVEGRIFRLSKLLATLVELKDEVMPEELTAKIGESELLLRGYIHQLEEHMA